MKVRVTLTVEVDPKAWADEYGIDKSEVRADVQQVIKNAAHDWLSGMGLSTPDEG